MTVPTNAEANALYPKIHTQEVIVTIHNCKMDFAFPPSLQRCAVCDSPTLRRCPRCYRTAYCSGEHEEQHKNAHAPVECDERLDLHHKYLEAREDTLRQLKQDPRLEQVAEISASFNYAFSP
jgi:hypothetical protein